MAKETMKVNVGTRSREEDAAALESLIAAETAEDGKEHVEIDGARFIKEVNAAGLTILTRVA